MLDLIGYKSVEEFLEQVIPKSIYRSKKLKIGKQMSESNALEALRKIANKNNIKTFNGFL